MEIGIQAMADGVWKLWITEISIERFNSIDRSIVKANQIFYQYKTILWLYWLKFDSFHSSTITQPNITKMWSQLVGWRYVSQSGKIISCDHFLETVQMRISDGKMILPHKRPEGKCHLLPFGAVIFVIHKIPCLHCNRNKFEKFPPNSTKWHHKFKTNLQGNRMSNCFMQIKWICYLTCLTKHNIVEIQSVLSIESLVNDGNRLPHKLEAQQ